MAVFGKSREHRRVRRGDTEPLDSETFYTRGEVLEPAPQIPKRRRPWKKFFVILSILVLLIGVALTGLYLYVKAIPLAGEGAGRVNIMVLGVDDAASLSDTIMIASIDTRSSGHPKVALISVPRDLYVRIPEFGSSKINAAYSYGQNENYPGGGAALSKATLEQTFDLPIHYYATLDFTGFRQLIDTVGGVDVEVKQDIDDPFYPTPDYSGFDHFELAAGSQHLDGETALRYARSRITTTDFDRAARQQQILIAFKNRVTARDILLSGNKRDQLQQTLKQHSQTDLNLRHFLKIALLLRKLEDQDITRHVIDSSNFLTSDGGGALVPRTGDFDEINQFITNIFSETGHTLPESQQ